jgi:hypothetical protein
MYSPQKTVMRLALIECGYRLVQALNRNMFTISRISATANFLLLRFFLRIEEKLWRFNYLYFLMDFTN